MTAATTDEKIVKMEFDNSDFEKNTKQTLGTLEKLKEKLQFSDAGKGLEQLGDATSNLSNQLNSVQNSADAVSVKFSAIEIAGMTVISRLTNAFINLGEQMVQSLSVQPVTDGFGKYEKELNAVQTILSGTDEQLNQIPDILDGTITKLGYVNKQLDRVTYFTDETSYSYSDIVDSISKFTSNGLGLEDTITAMQGISTWAAQAGDTAAQATPAFYNLSQAIGLGYIDYSNWKSVQNANMATMQFKENVMKTAIEMGKFVKVGDDAYIQADAYNNIVQKMGSTSDEAAEAFSEASSSLNELFSSDHMTRDKWFTTDLFMAVTKKYGEFADMVKSLHDTTGKQAFEVMDLVDQAVSGSSDALQDLTDELNYGLSDDAKKTSDEVKELITSDDMQMSESAYKMAQQTKTFSDAMNAVKDAVSTQWKTTFDILFGDLDQAKDLWGEYYEIIYKIFGTGGEIRNQILQVWNTFDEGEGRLHLLQGLENIWDSLNYIIGKVGDALAPLMPGFETVDNLAKTLGSRLFDVTEGFFNWTKSLPGIEAVSDAVSGVGDAAAAVTEPIETAYGSLKDWVTEVVRGDYGNGQDRIDALGDKYQTIQDKVNEIHDAYGTWEEGIESIDPDLQLVVSETQDITEATDGATTALSGVAEAAVAQQTIIQTGTTIYDDAALSIKGLISAFDILKKVLGYIWKFTEIFIFPIFKQLGRIFLAITGTVGDFNTKIDDALPSVEDMALVFESWKEKMKPITDILVGIVDKIVGFIRALREGTGVVKDSFTSLYNNSKFLQDIWSGLGKIVDWVSSIFSGFATNLDDANLSGLSDDASTASKVFGILGNAFYWVDDKLDGLVQTAKNLDWSWLTNVGSNIYDFVVNEFGKIQDFISSGSLGSLGDWISGLFNQGQFGSILDFLKYVYDGIKNFCDSVTGTVTDFKSNILGLGVFDLFTKKFGAAGKLLGFIGKFSAFSSLFGKAAAGSSDDSSEAVESADGIVTASGEIADAYGKIDSYMVDADGNIIQTEKDTDKSTTLMGKFKESLGNYKSLLSGISSWFKSKIIPGMQDVISNVKTFFKQMSDFFTSNIFPKLKVAFDKVKEVVSSIIEWLTTGDVLTKIQTIIKIFMGLQIGKALGSLSQMLKSFAGVGNGVTGVLKAFRKKINADVFKERMDSLSGVFKSIGLFFLAISASLFIVAQIKQEDLDKAINTFIKIGGLVVVLVGLLELFDWLKKKFSPAEVAKSGPASWMEVISGFLTDLTSSLKKFSVAAIIIAIAVAAWLLVDALKKMIDVIKAFDDLNVKPETYAKVAAAMGILAVGIALIAGSVHSFSGLGILATVLLLKVFMDALVKMIDIFKIYDELDLKDTYGTMMKVAIAAGILAGAIALMGWGAKGTGLAMFGVTAALSTLVKGIQAMVPVLESFDKMDSDKLGNSIKALTMIVGILTVAMVGMSLALRNYGKSKVSTVALLAASLLLYVLAGAVEKVAKSVLKFSDMSWSAIQKGLTVVIAIMLAFAGVAALISKTGKTGPLLAFSLMIGILTGSLLILSLLPFEKLKTSAEALVFTIGTIAIAIAAASKLSKDSTGSIIAMAAMIGIIALSLKSLSEINASKLQSAVEAMGIVVALITVFSGVSKLAESSATSIFATIGIIAAIGLSLYYLSSCDPSGVQAASIAMSIVVGMLTVFIGISKLAEGSWGSILACVAVIGMIGLVVWGLAQLPVDTVLPIVLSLSVLLAALSGSILILAAISVAGALSAVGALATFILGGTGLLFVLGLLSDIQFISDGVSAGLDALEFIAGRLGDVFGKFVAEFAKTSTSTLPDIGTSLNEFADNSKDFFALLSTISPDSANTASALAGALLALTAQNLLDQLTSFLGGGIDGDKLASQFSAFGSGLKAFSDSVSGISNYDSLTTAASAADQIITTMKDIPTTGGLAGFLFGENQFSTFGDSLASFGDGLKRYYDAVSGITDMSVISSSTDAAKSLTDFVDQIPDAGGIAQKFVGEKSLTTFASALPGFGLSLSMYSLSVSKLDTGAIYRSADAATALTDFANSIPNEGGLWAHITGDNTLSKFGGELALFGIKLALYSNNISGVDSESVMNSASAANKLAVMTENIPANSTGLTSFGTSLDSFGDHLKSYFGKISGLDTSGMADKVSSIVSSIVDNYINGFNDRESDFENVGSGFADSIAEGISSNEQTSIDAVSAFVTDFYNNMNSAVSSMSFSDVGGLMLSGFQDGMASKEPDIVDEARGLVEDIANAISDNVGDVTDACDEITDALSNVTSHEDDWYDLGRNCCIGLANGLRDYEYTSDQAAWDVGASALQSAKDAVKSASPSKKFIELGMYNDKGLAIGMNKYSYLAERAASNMSNSVLNIASAVGDAINTQPTISPILDLSNIESGAGQLSAMLNPYQSIRLAGSVSSSSEATLANKTRNQNGDVVDAIDSLKGSLANSTTGDTYQINGVTYGDDSAVQDAVKTLVRAVIVEGRN